MKRQVKKVEEELSAEEEQEVSDLEAEILGLRKKAQQFDDLKSASERGDHKAVFNKLGVRIMERSQEQPETKAPQRQEEPQNAAAPVDDFSVDEPTDNGELKKLRGIVQQQNQFLRQMAAKSQNIEQEMALMKQQSESTRLRSELGRTVRGLIENQEGSFLKHKDSDEVTEDVIHRLEKFKSRYGYDTTVDQVLSEMNNEYQNIFDKHVDSFPDDDDADGGQEEGKEEEQLAAKGQEPEAEEEFELAGESEETGEEERPKLKVIDPYDEDAMTKETDEAIDAVNEAEQLRAQKLASL